MAARPIAPPDQRPPAPKRQHKLTPDQQRELIAAYEAGESAASLARRFSLKRQTVPAILKRAGTPIRPRKIMNGQEVDRAVALYECGLSSAAIANELGYDQATIHRRLVERGVQMRSPNAWQR